ncbi:ATP-binding protein [Nocardia sp. NPDC051832]|uniref:sensor histidine kinase n=1 Tax=Nocardia sp. NPDC051832 TaxID=3155673 RepID=UPI003428D67E
MSGTRFPRISLSWPRRIAGVRARLLAIVLIPSIALLAAGISGSVYLIRDGQKANRFAELSTVAITPAILMVEAFQEERRVSLLHLAGAETAAAALPATREHSDAALAALVSTSATMQELRPDLTAPIEGYRELYKRLPQLRGGIDARVIPAQQVFGAFSQIVHTVTSASLLVAEVAPDARVAVELYKAVHALRAAESVSRTSSLGSVAVLTEQVSPQLLTELGSYIGDGRGEVAYVGSTLQGQRLEQLKAITAGAEWQQLVAMEDAIIKRGPYPDDDETSSRTRKSAEDEALPLDVVEWQRVAGTVRSNLMQLWKDQSADSHHAAAEHGERVLLNSYLGGAGIFSLAVLAFLAALVLANRFVARMRRLRRDTLELADERLPDTIRRLSTGTELDTKGEVAGLDYGTDEVGQVANAFNRAHLAAVSAAVAESQTRAGVNAVFLNIAHRSQVVVHRQLALLDTAERAEEDPAYLDLLFQLDHLATRARRNAENLIILGGEQPGRQWRHPVPLIDVIRGAVAESLDYTRIQVGRLPDTYVSGGAVADVIHLLAELADNATAYSPPESRVDIDGVLVGRGVAVEITDQGLGMSPAELAARNAVLADPPDFSVAALSGDARLGLFVVAKLAARHGVTVRLTESDYGGVKAIVLVPTAVTVAAEISGRRPPE